MKAVILSPSINGIQARLLRHPRPYPMGMRYELQESADSVTWVGSRAYKQRFASVFPAQLTFQQFLDDHYPGTKVEDCQSPRFEPDGEDVKAETEADKCRRFADMVRNIPGGYGELADYLSERAHQLSK